MKTHKIQQLEAEVALWRENVIKAENGTFVFEDMRTSNSFICRNYSKCKGCPVAEFTGDIECYNTPWYELRDMLENGLTHYLNNTRKMLSIFEGCLASLLKTDAMIPDEDLLVTTPNPHPSGGQHVGVYNGVTVKHLPTGITVTVECDRSQARNRMIAEDAILGALTSPHRRS